MSKQRAQRRAERAAVIAVAAEQRAADAARRSRAHARRTALLGFSPDWALRAFVLVASPLAAPVVHTMLSRRT